MRTGGSPDPRPRLRLLAVVVALSLVVPGVVVGAGLKVTKGTAERARGLYLAANDLGTWWVATKFAVMTVPATVPPLASALNGSPTMLPNGTTSLVAANATSGATAIAWSFSLTSAAPLSSEIELRLNVSIAAGPTLHLIIFLVTNASAVSGTATVRLFVPTSGVMPSQTDLESSTVRSLACTAVGSCP